MSNHSIEHYEGVAAGAASVMNIALESLGRDADRTAVEEFKRQVEGVIDEANQKAKSRMASTVTSGPNAF